MHARVCVCAPVRVCVFMIGTCGESKAVFPPVTTASLTFPAPGQADEEERPPLLLFLPRGCAREPAFLFSLSGSRNIQHTGAPYGELGDGSGRGDRRRQRGHAGQSWPPVKQATSLGFSTRCILALSTQLCVAMRKENGKQNFAPTINLRLFRCEAMGIVPGSPHSASARLTPLTVLT